MSNLIYTDADKKSRAEDIFRILKGERPRLPGAPEHYAYLKDAHSALLAEQKVDLKDKEKAVHAIYKNLGGATITEEQDVKLKSRSSRNKIGRTAKMAKDSDDDEGTSADDED